MTDRIQSEFSIIGLFAIGVILPLVASSMVPNGWQRPGAAVFSIVGIGIMSGMVWSQPGPFHWGLCFGLMLAAIKLISGLRFL